jgi:hypothetical protein
MPGSIAEAYFKRHSLAGGGWHLGAVEPDGDHMMHASCACGTRPTVVGRATLRAEILNALLGGLP